MDLFHDFRVDPLLFVTVDEVPGEEYLGLPACVEGAEDEPPDLGYPHFLVAQPKCARPGLPDVARVFVAPPL